MKGAIIGDIIGSRYEFDNTSDYDFELFGPGCDYTDNTICTVAVADAVLRDLGYAEALRAWCRRYPHPRGEYDSYFFDWVNRPDPYPYNSFGNDSAMRVSPIAWFYDNEDEVRLQAEASAAVTHNHPEGIKGAVAIAVAILRIRRRRSKIRISLRTLPMNSITMSTLVPKPLTGCRSVATLTRRAKDASPCLCISLPQPRALKTPFDKRCLTAATRAR